MKKCGASISPFVAVIRYTFDLIKRLPYEQRYLSCITFSVYEVARVICQDKNSKNEKNKPRRALAKLCAEGSRTKTLPAEGRIESKSNFVFASYWI